MGIRSYIQQAVQSTVYYGSNVSKNMVIVQLWGAGGGGGTPGGWSFGAEGGGGGYVYAEIPITQLIGKSLVLVVGEGGLVNGTRLSYGGGGQANRTGTDNRYGSNGGGYTGLFLNGVSQSNALAIAGGGGGGGSSRAGAGNVGGAGGGTTGQDGVSAYDSKTGYRGLGGTQSAAGAEASSDSANTTAPGAALLGGTCRTNGYGGAGGGGYWGGSAGGYSESNTMGGGGGGSGYLNPSYVIAGQNIQGNLKTPAGINQLGFPGTSVAYGGDASSAGKNGFARITINGVTREYNYTGSDIIIPILSSTIITSGLVLWLDAGNTASYPGSGSTWTDLSGNGNNMTLTGSPTFSSNNGGVLQFNGSSQYGTLNLNYSTTTYTIMAGSRYSGATRGRVVTAINNNWLLGHWNSTTENYYAEGWVTSVGAGANDTNWRIYAATENYSGDLRSFYVNNSASVTNSTAGSQGFNGLSVGKSILNGEPSNCEVSFILVYNRILTQEELTQNFEALRGRFGI